jgi:sulfoxide reductase heme-binding subunit YedZ
VSDSTLWYISRGTGLVSLMLLTLVVVLGVLTRGGRPMPGLPRFAVAGLHRNAALLALTFLVIHVVTIVSDVYANVGWLDVVVPFVSNFRPVWVGLGTIALELFVAVIATSMLRPWIGLRTWRLTHWAVYAAWPIGMAHGFGTGRDVGKVWMIAITAMCIATVVGAVGWRIVDAAKQRRELLDTSVRSLRPTGSFDNAHGPLTGVRR